MQGSADITLIDSNYRSPWWLPGEHLQTIYARYRCGLNQLDYRRERWETPDGDFIDLDWIDSERNDAKLLVLFHGLEGWLAQPLCLDVNVDGTPAGLARRGSALSQLQR